MDTCINLSGSNFSLFISPQELASGFRLADAPLLLDVRPQAAFDASPRMLMGARRCSLEDVPTPAAGLNARVLAGGFEGGEDGVDSVQEIAQWRNAQLPTIAKAQA